ncbi:hypothetical protein E4U15_005169 [Claviceps sp. LM218 group G6]|nr:hypothetical protein E4U15_005169 [Claviceps sp. LM218 group G6]
MHLSGKFLARALALLVPVSIASGHSTVLVDPVIVEDGLDHVKTKSTTTPDKLEYPYADMRIASFRKEIIHAEKDTTPEASATKPDFAIDKRGMEKYFVWQDTHISLVNATPYRWHMISNSSYRLHEWDLYWPLHISPGETVTVRVNNIPHRQLPSKDAVGEVTYEIEGTRQPASFQVQYRSGMHHRVWVQFRDQLRTLNTAVNSEHYLGLDNVIGAMGDLLGGANYLLGGVGFVLAGKEGDFLSQDGPRQWMQAQLDEIGDLPLRSIALPRSHNSGMWLPSHRIGFGQPENCLTQSKSIYDQVRTGGVRVIDFHPLLLKNLRYHSATGFWLGPRYHGLKGPELRLMIDQLNRFMWEYPGELFIWDLSFADARSARRHYKMLNDGGDLKRLHEELKLIRHRLDLRYLHKQDITLRPLKEFISPELKKTGRSTVIIRVPSTWAKTGIFPAKEGFISEDYFPLSSHRIKNGEIGQFVKDHVAALKAARPSRMALMYNMAWFRAVPILEVLSMRPSLHEFSKIAWPGFYTDIWSNLSDTTYPNMVSMDNIHGSALKAMVMVINKCFVARKCGSLGGMVKWSEDVDKEGNDEKNGDNGEENEGGGE